MTYRWWVVAVLLLALAGCEHRAGARPGRPPATTPVRGMPASMAALGDSVTSGFGSCVFLTTCQRNSWSTGDGLRVESHFRRIAEANPAIRGHVTNHAVPKARAAGLATQATAAARQRPEYVTVLIGANDICHGPASAMTAPDAFRASVDRALATLERSLPQARILVASVPDLYRLWQLGHTNAAAVRAWSRGVCPALLANATSTAPADAARREAVRDRVTAYNRALAAACRAHGPRCRYDGGAVHAVRFTLAMVNQLDYFHPSVAGQNALADATYPRSFSW